MSDRDPNEFSPRSNIPLPPHVPMTPEDIRMFWRLWSPQADTISAEYAKKTARPKEKK